MRNTIETSFVFLLFAAAVTLGVALVVAQFAMSLLGVVVRWAFRVRGVLLAPTTRRRPTTPR